jgi:hypothetical protein
MEKQEAAQKYGSGTALTHKQRIVLIGPNSDEGGKQADQLMSDLNGKHRALLPEGWRVERQTGANAPAPEPPPAGTPGDGAVRSSVQLEQDVAKRQAEQQSRAQSGHSEQDAGKRGR